jgi:hypothetical protein
MLDSKNLDGYDRWCVKMRAIFGFQEVLDVILTGVPELPTVATEAQRALFREAKRKDCKAMFYLHQCIDEANFEKISSAASAKEAWDILASSYAGVARLKQVRLQTLRRQYELLQMEPQETVAVYFNRVQSIVNLMKSCGETFTSRAIVEKVLRTLDSRFDYIVVAIEESRNLDDLKVEELQGSLEAHEQRLHERLGSKPTSEQALLAQSEKKSDGDRGRGRKRGRGRGWRGGSSGGRGSHGGRGFQNGSQNSFKQDSGSGESHSSRRGGSNASWRGDKRYVDKSQIQCYNCERYGHYARDCWGKGNANKKDEEANVAHKDELDDDEVLLMVTTTKPDDDLPGSWYLHTGCSNHMACRKEWFVQLDERI